MTVSDATVCGLFCGNNNMLVLEYNALSVLSEHLIISPLGSSEMKALDKSYL